MRTRSKRLALAATLTVASAVSSLFCANGIAHAVCGSDRPCFTEVHMEGPTTLVANWTVPDTFDSYYENFRYSSGGGPEPQSETYGPPYRIYGVQPGVTYTLKVQRCTRGVFSSDCSPWDATQFTVPTPEPPAPPPPEPRKVERPFSSDVLNPHDCPICQMAGN